jgi:hypothetical protein
MKKILSIVLLTVAVAIFANHAQAQAIIIANPSIKSAEVSRGDLKDVFTGVASSLKDGSKATPVLLKGGPVHDEFLSAYIGKSDTAFKATWRSLVFSGQSSMPKSLDSETAMVAFVAQTPGAIGYISKATPHGGVKVLIVK